MTSSDAGWSVTTPGGEVVAAGPAVELTLVTNDDGEA